MFSEMQAFIDTFGEMTIASVVVVVAAIVFMYKIYGKIKKFFEQKIESEKETQEALELTKKYPEWRQQSKNIQKSLQEDIDGLKAAQTEMKLFLEKIDGETKRRERNRLRDNLLKSYRHYTNKEINPNQEWNQMEAEAFWEQFRDYEDLNGNGFIHTVVQPAMNMLKIVDIEE